MTIKFSHFTHMFESVFSKNKEKKIIIIIVIFLLRNNRIQNYQYRPSLLGVYVYRVCFAVTPLPGKTLGVPFRPSQLNC